MSYLQRKVVKNVVVGGGVVVVVGRGGGVDIIPVVGDMVCACLLAHICDLCPFVPFSRRLFARMLI